MTYSIAGWCEKTGAVGAAITTSSIAVTSRCVWVSPNHGVVLSQNVTDPRLGTLGLKLLQQGYGAAAVVKQLQNARPHGQWRQLAALDTDGNSHFFSGDKALGLHAGKSGQNCVAVGNLLATEEVPTKMVESFTGNSSKSLPERLLTALKAGLDAGGETADERSAGIIVYGLDSWPTVDLRVDWDEDPINRLISIWEEYKPQMQDYILRAKNPDAAPDF